METIKNLDAIITYLYQKVGEADLVVVRVVGGNAEYIAHSKDLADCDWACMNSMRQTVNDIKNYKTIGGAGWVDMGEYILDKRDYVIARLNERKAASSAPSQ